ncbi:MAG: Mut7-C RNAse domain-containing protein [Candidatus Bathyarchaeota archaeon]|nr:Mut7-C RNAse domain-containing protein [Candidatus Bathyarchaeota archaeon]
MNFIVDCMLGKLARWLRMMGHNVKYFTELRDTELLYTAKIENRVLLTRDLMLYRQATGKGVEVYYVEGKNEPERLAELAQRFKIELTIDLEKSRCPKCNTNLRPVTKHEITNKVKKNTLKYYDKFWLCLNCGKVYWQGAHWINIWDTFKKAEEKMKS